MQDLIENDDGKAGAIGYPLPCYAQEPLATILVEASEIACWIAPLFQWPEQPSMQGPIKILSIGSTVHSDSSA